MKSSKQSISAIAALAFIGLGQSALPAGAAPFTLLEQLAPSDRIAVQKYVDESGAQIDYENYVLGINMDGQITTLPKNLLEAASAGQPCSISHSFHAQAVKD